VARFIVDEWDMLPVPPWRDVGWWETQRTIEDQTGEGQMMKALASMTDNRKRIAFLTLLSFIAMC